MAITTTIDAFLHELSAIFDAEKHFLKGMEEMHKHATDVRLRGMIEEHIKQSEHQVRNLDRVFEIVGIPHMAVASEPARGLATEAKMVMHESKEGSVRDFLIASAAAKVEHFEVACYRSLLAGARLLEQTEIGKKLGENLEQEEQTALRLEAIMLDLAQKPAPGTLTTGNLQLKERMTILGTDDANVGHIKEVRKNDFLVDRPMQRDLYIPMDAVQEVNGDQVKLNIPASKVDDMGWKKGSII